MNDELVNIEQETQMVEKERLEAERDKLISESESYKSEKAKYEAERKEIESRINQPWYKIKLVSIIQAIIAGVVAGMLIWAFSVDHIKKLYELQKELAAQQKLLEIKTKEYQDKIQDLELRNSDSLAVIEELRNQIVLAKSLESKNNQITAESEEQLETLSSLQQKIDKADGGSWFPVIASTYNETDLAGRLERIRNQEPKYKIGVYKTTDKKGAPVWAITLGGYLAKEVAMERITYAKENDIAPDAYIWRSEIWGEDLSKKYEK